MAKKPAKSAKDNDRSEDQNQDALLPVLAGDLAVDRARVDGEQALPALIPPTNARARYAWDEFLASLDSDHTRRAYRIAIERLSDFCVRHGLTLQTIKPSDLREHLDPKRLVNISKNPSREGDPLSKPSRKLHLAAIRRLFDFFVVRHVVDLNPAASVKGPKHSVDRGKTPVLTTKQARAVLASIQTENIVGLRDRAIIGVLIYTASRVGAVAKLSLRDLFPDGTQMMLRLDEKGGKLREVPVRHDLEAFLKEYLVAARLDVALPSSPLFRTTEGRSKRLTSNRMSANDMLRMAKRRFKDAGLDASRFKCHSFRATTATNLIDQGANIEDVQFLLGHSDPRTTQLYDRTQKKVTRNLVERISI